MAVPKGVRIGGRGKGAKNKTTIAREAKVEEVINKAVELGVTPLEVMLNTMRTKYQQKDYDGACAIAKDAAPYIHPRLASIDNTIKAANKTKFTLNIEGGDDGIS